MKESTVKEHDGPLPPRSPGSLHFTSPPEVLGYYLAIGSTMRIPMYVKPPLFRRVMAQWLLGVIWIEANDE